MRRLGSLLSFLFLLLCILAIDPSGASALSPRLPKPDQRRPHHGLHQVSWIVRLRNRIIQSVFGIPDKPKPGRLHRQCSAGRQPISRLPPTLLAQYGHDIVIRFKITSSEEEKALAEAANTLLLDVWDFSEGRADIRLAQDEVREAYRYI